MTKNDIINETVAELSAELTQNQLDRVKITLLVKFKGYEIAEVNTLPSVVVYDNEYIYKRFMIDMLAKEYDIDTDNLRDRMEDFFGMRPCQGI